MNESNHIREDEVGLVRRFARGRSRPAAASCPNGKALAAALDGRLSAAETALFEEHLALCSQCRQALIEARELVSAPPAPPTPGLIARARALVGEPTPAWRWRAAATWAAAAAAVLALGLAGWSAGSAVGEARERGPDSLAAALPLELAQSDPDDVFARLAANNEEGSHE